MKYRYFKRHEWEEFIELSDECNSNGLVPCRGMCLSGLDCLQGATLFVGEIKTVRVKPSDNGVLQTVSMLEVRVTVGW